MLEIGCDTGFVLSGIEEKIPFAKLNGCEIFTDGLAFAAKRLPSVSSCKRMLGTYPLLLNFIFEKVLNIQFAGIRAGINYPLGGSRLVVAQKG